MGRVDPEIDWYGRDAFIGTRHPVGLGLDLLAYFIKVGVLLPLLMQKLRPFRLGVVQLENEGPPGDYARPSGQEVPGER